MTRRQRWNLGWSRCIIRHVSVSYGRHCHDRPPKRIWYGFEEAVLTSRLSEVHRGWKQHHTLKNKHTPTENTVRHTVVGMACERRGGEGGRVAARHRLPHISIADCGHRNYCPPEGIRNAIEISVMAVFVSKKDSTGKDHDTCERKITCERTVMTGRARVEDYFRNIQIYYILYG